VGQKIGNITHSCCCRGSIICIPALYHLIVRCTRVAAETASTDPSPHSRHRRKNLYHYSPSLTRRQCTHERCSPRSRLLSVSRTPGLLASDPRRRRFSELVQRATRFGRSPLSCRPCLTRWRHCGRDRAAGFDCSSCSHRGRGCLYPCTRCR